MYVVVFDILWRVSDRSMYNNKYSLVMDNGDMLNTINKVTGLIKYKFNDQPN